MCEHHKDNINKFVMASFGTGSAWSQLEPFRDAMKLCCNAQALHARENLVIHMRLMVYQQSLRLRRRENA